MLRSAVTILLIFPLLGSQVLVLPHTHVGTDVAEPEDHGLRPHFHLHGNVGHHQHDASHHDHHSTDRRPAKKVSDDVETAAVNSAHDHDHDAVFLPHALVYDVNGKAAPVESSKQVIDSRVWVLRSPTTEDARAASFRPHPPPGHGFCCLLSLRTLSLRI